MCSARGLRVALWIVALSVLGMVRPAGAQPERIVSLVPAATETLFEIGAGDRLVAVSSYASWPPAVRELPRVGALLDPDLEAILALEPDLVVLDPAQDRLRAQLAAAGIEAVSWRTDGIAELLEDTRRLGAAVGRPAAAAELAAGIAARLEELRAAHADGEGPATALVFGRRPGSFGSLWVNGGVGFLDEVMEIAGARNVFGDVERESLRAGLEGILRRRPRVVVELRSRQEDVDPERLEAEWRALPGFGGVRVVVLAMDSLMVPGPRLPEAVEALAAAIRGDRDRGRR